MLAYAAATLRGRRSIIKQIPLSGRNQGGGCNEELGQVDCGVRTRCYWSGWRVRDSLARPRWRADAADADNDNDLCVAVARRKRR